MQTAMDKRNRQRRRAAGALIGTLLPSSGPNYNHPSPPQEPQTQAAALPPSPAFAPQQLQAAPLPLSGAADTTSGATAARPSQAQPRPALRVPPRGIGPIFDPNPNDVLCGRGGRINAHAGNVQFRAMVQARKKTYLAKETRKLAKAHIAAEIVATVRDMQPSGRFLKEDPDGSWYDIGDAKAIKKVGQALREDAPDFREDDDGEDSPSPKSKAKESSRSPKPGKPGDAMVASAAIMAHGNEQAAFSAATHGAYGLTGPNAVYQPVVPSARFSGAAAAAIRESDDYVMYSPQPQAFGRQFHPAAVYAAANPNVSGNFSNLDSSSLISGLSNPTLLSGMSLSSAVSDPHLASLARQSQPQPNLPQHLNPMIRASQLQQLRMQWAATQQHPPGGMGAAGGHHPSPSDYSRMMLAQAGLLTTGGHSFVGPHNVVGPLPPLSTAGRMIRSDSMSWAGNSSGHTVNEHLVAAVDGREDEMGERDRRSHRGDNFSSVLSIGDDTYPSMAESIMSDLSDNLIALDLAEPRLLDQI